MNEYFQNGKLVDLKVFLNDYALADANEKKVIEAALYKQRNTKDIMLFELTKIEFDKIDNPPPKEPRRRPLIKGDENPPPRRNKP